MRRIAFFTASALIALGALAACSSTETGERTAVTPTPGETNSNTAPGGTATVPAAASIAPPATMPPMPACQPGSALPPAGTTSEHTLSSGGVERSYLLYVPPGYDGRRPAPLVLNFHGLGSTGAQQHIYAGLVPVAEREGFLVASPDGINRAWLTNPGIDDIQFTRDLVEEISRLACIDAGRVYATGMSNGGFMSAALACVAGDLLAAVAPVAGMTPANRLCGEPVPFIEFHGTGDSVVPYEPGILAPTGGDFAGVPELIAGWAAFNGCEGEPTERRLSDEVVFREFGGCDAPTGHYVVAGGGHTWPGAIAIGRLGATTRDISAAEIAWAFFEANPR